MLEIKMKNIIRDGNRLLWGSIMGSLPLSCKAITLPTFALPDGSILALWVPNPTYSSVLPLWELPASNIGNIDIWQHKQIFNTNIKE